MFTVPSVLMLSRVFCMRFPEFTEFAEEYLVAPGREPTGSVKRVEATAFAPDIDTTPLSSTKLLPAAN